MSAGFFRLERKMNIDKKFNEWISMQFKGLSVTTLTQFLNMDVSHSIFRHLNMESVHVDLYQYFTGVRTDKICAIFETIKELVNLCDWL